ncbi:lysine--tRNA ligase [Candidatus Woesearchaeota archaeon]|nr:lysine--tRNA ligase [Candidatus Woesearchaeota archaeon]
MAKKETKAMHWADQAAEQIIKKKDKKEYVVATGVTPSGTLHIGNFRELITGDIIKRALIDAGKKAVHYHYWDDYDVFRKVPANMPKPEILKKYLRQALIYVPDVIDNKHKNYAYHNEKEIEELLPIVDVKPTILRHAERYMNCEYAKEMKIALENTDKIKEIFNKYRKEELEESWLPISVYCEKCHLEAEKIKYEGMCDVSYECSCGDNQTFDISKKGLAKLKWRVQWPAWWNNKDVDFESAGKDHFAAGSGIDTGREVQRKIYKTEPPIGFGFGWIGVKGGKQFSSSAGVIFTLKDVLDVYEPAIVRYIFASSRPSYEFAISFDLDVLKVYEDFDKCERIYHMQEEVDEKEFEKQKRIYELSYIGKPPKDIPFQPVFRHLTNVLQTFEKDLNKTTEFFKNELKTSDDKKRFETRLKCVLNWLEHYAPDDFKFTVQKQVHSGIELSDEQKQALHKVAELLKKDFKNDTELHEAMYKISQDVGLNAKDFFKGAYLVLVNKEKGPRLASFILTIGKDKVSKLFANV